MCFYVHFHTRMLYNSALLRKKKKTKKPLMCLNGKCFQRVREEISNKHHSSCPECKCLIVFLERDTPAFWNKPWTFKNFKNVHIVLICTLSQHGLQLSQLNVIVLCKMSFHSQRTRWWLHTVPVVNV